MNQYDDERDEVVRALLDIIRRTRAMEKRLAAIREEYEKNEEEGGGDP